MSTATELPPGHVVCPRCGGSGLIHLNDPPPFNSNCHVCNKDGKFLGYISDPLIAEWFAEDTKPARLIEMLPQPVDEGKLREWVEACDEALSKRANVRVNRTPLAGGVEFWSSQDDNPPGRLCIENWQTAAFLRCLFACPHMPREMVECPECGGRKILINVKGRAKIVDCEKCKGTGKVTAPIIDPRWKSSTVLDLAKVIRGDAPRRTIETNFVLLQRGNRLWREGVIEVWLDPPYPEIGDRVDLVCLEEALDSPDANEGVRHAKTYHGLFVIGSNGRHSFSMRQDDRSVPVQPPQPNHHLLHDALMDAGCDNEFILKHLEDGTVHVPGHCYVVNLLCQKS